MIFGISCFDDAVFYIDSIFVQVAGRENEIGDLRLGHPACLDLHVEVEREQLCLLEVLGPKGFPELYLFQRGLKRLGDDDAQIVGSIAVALQAGNFDHLCHLL